MALLVMLIGLLPPSRVKNWLLRRVGWDVAASARIDPVIFFRVRYARFGEGCHLGALSVYRDLAELTVGAESGIGQLNWVTTDASVRSAEGGFLRLGDGSALTSRHYLDCTGGIAVGDRTIIAGFRSTLVSHGINVGTALQDVAGITIGDECLIMTNVVITPGRRISRRSVVAGGAVVAADLDEEMTLYGGVPARPIAGRADAEYFAREKGFVDWSEAARGDAR